uniref:Urocanase C-terminal domain-containing protein n=1 Tax=Ciona intestinalis TaxID=7719 RepID=F6W736_CIOIN
MTSVGRIAPIARLPIFMMNRLFVRTWQSRTASEIPFVGQHGWPCINGSGVGWGEVVNGGFGVVLDGSEDAGLKAGSMLAWDVSNGVTRRAWAGNVNAMDTIKVAMTIDPNLEVTLPSHVTDDVLNGQI